MKSISKTTGARSQRPGQPTASLSKGTKRKTRIARDVALDDVVDERWDAIEADIDLEDFDYDSIDDADPASGDWLADRDLALEIAQRALH
jgi:hypothetical protein